jgi:kinesin family member C1
MIPRAIIKIFETTERLKEQGWVYELEGQFLEIVNGLGLSSVFSADIC